MCAPPARAPHRTRRAQSECFEGKINKKKLKDIKKAKMPYDVMHSYTNLAVSLLIPSPIAPHSCEVTLQTRQAPTKGTKKTATASIMVTRAIIFPNV